MAKNEKGEIILEKQAQLFKARLEAEQGFSLNLAEENQTLINAYNTLYAEKKQLEAELNALKNPTEDPETSKMDMNKEDPEIIPPTEPKKK